MDKAHQISRTSICNNEKVANTMKKTLIPIIFVFMALLLSACGDTTQSTPSQTTSAPTTQPTSVLVTKVPTAPPKPTINLNLAVLGRSIHAFDQKFGSNNCCYRNGWTPPNGPYVAVEDDTYNGLNVDETSMNRVVLIEIQPQSDGQTTDPVWSALNTARIYNAYLPPDAKYQSSFLVPLADVTKGSVKVYYSALLAHSLPAKDFVDRNGKQGKPGTIYVYFDYHYDASHIGECILDLQGNDSLWA